MYEDHIRFVHVISDELLKVVQRKDEKKTSFEARQHKCYIRRIVKSLAEQHEIITIDDKPLIDCNWFRRYTYAFVFHNAENGDYESVSWAFARQGDADKFTKAVGRSIAEMRLINYLDTGKRFSFRDMNPAPGFPRLFTADSASVDQLDCPEFSHLPDKVVRTIISQRSDYYKKNNMHEPNRIVVNQEFTAI